MKIKPESLLYRISLWLSGIAAILQAVAMFVCYESGSNYFKAGAILPTVALGVVLASALFGTVSVILTKRESLQESIFPASSRLNPALLGFFGAFLMFLFFAANLLSAVAALMLLFGAVYCALVCLPKPRRGVNRPALCAMIGIIGLLLVAAYYYFDKSVEMNSPIKTYLQVSVLFAMLYFTSEVRYLLGKPSPKLFLLLSQWLLAASALVSVSLPIAFLYNKVRRMDYAAGGALLLFFGMHAVIRSSFLRYGERRLKKNEDPTILDSEGENQ